MMLLRSSVLSVAPAVSCSVRNGFRREIVPQRSTSVRPPDSMTSLRKAALSVVSVASTDWMAFGALSVSTGAVPVNSPD